MLRHMDKHTSWPKRTKIDWPAVVRDLKQAHTYQEIGDACGMSRGAVFDLGSGRSSSPLYEAGAVLVGMHRKVRRRK